MDETWKLSKGRSRSTTTNRSLSSKNYSKQQEPYLLKSYSQRPSSSSSSSKRSPPLLTKSFSQRASSSRKQSSSHTRGTYSGDSVQKGSSSSSSSSSIGKKCGSLAKEQKARFYIMRRCVAMLVCWHKHVDDS